jgi:Matrixin
LGFGILFPLAPDVAADNCEPLQPGRIQIIVERLRYAIKGKREPHFREQNTLRRIAPALLRALAFFAAIILAMPSNKATAQTGKWAEAGASVFMPAVGTAGNIYLQALHTAAQRWNFQPFTFDITDNGTGAAECGNAPGANVMMAYFSPTICGAAWTPSLVGTVALKYSSSGRYITTGDILFNSSLPNSNTYWSVYTGPLRAGSMDFTRVAVHELGRLAGLPDSNDPSSIMFSQPTNVESPTSADFNAIDALYQGVPARPLGGFGCSGNTTPPFVGLGPVSGNYTVTQKCLDATHSSVNYSFSLQSAAQLTINLYQYHTEINLEVLNAQNAVLYSETDDGKLQKSYQAQFNPGNYTVRLWREVAGSTYDLNFVVQ